MRDSREHAIGSLTEWPDVGSDSQNQGLAAVSGKALPTISPWGFPVASVGSLDVRREIQGMLWGDVKHSILSRKLIILRKSPKLSGCTRPLPLQTYIRPKKRSPDELPRRNGNQLGCVDEADQLSYPKGHSPTCSAACRLCSVHQVSFFCGLSPMLERTLMLLLSHFSFCNPSPIFL